MRERGIKRAMSSESQADERPGVGRSIWLLVLGGCTAVVLLTSTGEYARARLSGEAVGFFEMARYQAIDWYFWALAAPLVFALARRVRPARIGWARSAAVHAAAGAVLACVHLGAYVAAALAMTGQLTAADLARMLPVAATARLHVEALAYLALLGLAYAVEYYTVSRERTMRASRLEARLAQAQLEVLRSQLQPHFLFNALNAVAALVRRDRNREAVDVIAGLGDLLRDTLDSPEHEVPLAREIELLEHYLAIQRVRFGDRLAVELDVAPETLDAAVPGLVLQPLVENAIRHGIETRDEPGRITVLAARAGGGRLRLEVVDDGPGIGPGAREGVGLGNTRARLGQLYGDAHRFEVERIAGGGTAVHIELPLRRIARTDEASSPGPARPSSLPATPAAPTPGIDVPAAP